jgi:hypothetical protein
VRNGRFLDFNEKFQESGIIGCIRLSVLLAGTQILSSFNRRLPSFQGGKSQKHLLLLSGNET